MKLIKESLNLDYELFKNVQLPLISKLELVIKKYLYLCISLLGMGQKQGKFMGKKFYFINKFGYVGLQRIFTDNDYLKNYLPDGLSVLDIGAHIGEFAFFSTNHLIAKLVVSVEPFSESFQLLTLNNPGKNFEYAITSKKINKLYVSEISTQLNSLYSDSTRKQTREVKIRPIKLKDFINNDCSKIKFDLLKIDTEGSEFDVLESGVEVIKNFKYILVEVKMDSSNFQNITNLLNKIGGYELLAMSNYRQGQRSVDMLFVAK